MREEKFLEQPQQNQPKTSERGDFELDKKDIGDANAITDDWDQYMAKSESISEEKLMEEEEQSENLSVQEMEEIESELRGKQEVNESVSESKKDFPVKWFKTEKDSIYAYDNDGKTSRFKTVEGKQYERQDVTVFVNLTPEETEGFLDDMNIENIGIYVVEELPNGEPHIIKDISEVQDPEEIYLASLNIDKERWVRKKKASLKPIIGYTPFDTRVYEKDGKLSTDVHLGHKIVEIETTQEPITEPSKERIAPESASILDEVSVQNTEMEEMKVVREVAAESAKEELQNENMPASGVNLIENNEKKEMSDVAINKEKISDLISTGRRLVYAFRERNEEKLNSLIEEQYISPLAASFDNLHMLLRDDKQTVNGEELNYAIVRINNMIQNIGNVPLRQSMRDNIESLGKVIFRLKEVENKARDTALSLSVEKEDRLEEILKSLRKLEDTIREKWIFVARKRDALIQY